MTPEPDHRTALMSRATAALDELHDLRCSDPAAAHAMRVVHLTGYTLEHFWIPALEQQLGTDRHEA